MNKYDIVDGKSLRYGYTTGTCAAVATHAALINLLDAPVSEYDIDLPCNETISVAINSNEKEGGYAISSVIKDAGDDPDQTNGIEIFAKVSLRDDGKVIIKGGEGIGIYTNDSIFGKKGEYAINKVPREMITKEVELLTDKGADVTIFTPMGVEIGKKTFNPNIGIEGGISIIGSTGLVKPMSEDALLKTIELEIRTLYVDKGAREIVLTPGSHGLKEANSIGINENIVLTSNYIGDSLKMAYEIGFRKITLVGHIGKFAKLSIGVFNTHSKNADTRMEAFVYYLAMLNKPYEVIKEVDAFITAEKCYNYLYDSGYKDVLCAMEEGCAKRVKTYLKDEALEASVKVYSFEKGVLDC